MIDNKPLVTIGIPTYNRAGNYLKHALHSAISQTYPNIEIVVSDNCSTDHTEELVKNYDNPNIRYFKQKINIGAINNSNFCLDQSEGDYFMQLHDDDMIDDDFVEVCMKTANYSTDIGIIRTGTRVIDSNNNILQNASNTSAGLSVSDFFRFWFADKTSIYLCSTLFNRLKLKEAGGFISRHNLFDDVAAIARLSEFNRIDIEEIKASFRKHGNEETHSAKIRNWCEDSIYLLELICSVVSKESRDDVRMEGMHFFSNLNYRFAGLASSQAERIMAYLTVFRFYEYKYIPPKIKSILYRNPLTNTLRLIKNTFKIPTVKS